MGRHPLSVAPSAYVTNVLRRHLQEQTLASAESELALLQQINIGLSEEEWQRYNALRALLSDGTLRPAEQAELIALSAVWSRRTCSASQH